MSKIVPVVLCGGGGSRLWPLSRVSRPKQFLAPFSDKSLLQLTLLRLEDLQVCDPPIIVANDDHRFLVGDQCSEVGVTPKLLMLEPMARNTAPAITVAALAATASGDDPILLVLPSDHLIKDNFEFRRSVLLAVEAAESGFIVTFGVTPTRAETGYGYIKTRSDCPRGFSAMAVDRFVEKPDLIGAESFVRDSSYFWNSGIFLMRSSVYLSEIRKYAPNILSSCSESFKYSEVDLDFLRLQKDAFRESPSDSIDYAVMEKSDKVKLVPMNAGWTDVGSWESVSQLHDADNDGNSKAGDVVFSQSKNCHVHATSRLVALEDVKDLIIVETPDAVLVVPKHSSQEIKKLVDKLRILNRPEIYSHREVHRPWGFYDSLSQGDRYQVKLLSVKPGARLSVQMHHHRAEHWVIVKGTAKVTIGDRHQLVSENQSVYIPIGERHCLENPGKVVLELIEIQSGTYLGEDDIVRFEDKYQRT